MRPILPTFLIAVLLLQFSLLPAGPKYPAPKFEPISNGKDLEGWDSKPGAWELRDGEIWCTGKSEEKNWLIWRGGEPDNFRLRLEFKWGERKFRRAGSQ